MGMYDSIELNGIAFQTKAFGRGLAHYKPGDEVTLEVYAQTDEEAAVARTYVYDEVPRRYAVEVYAVEHVIVEDGRIVGLASESDLRDLTYDSFDSYGRDVADGLAHIFGEHRPRRTMSPHRPPVSEMPRRPRHPKPTDTRED